MLLHCVFSFWVVLFEDADVWGTLDAVVSLVVSCHPGGSLAVFSVTAWEKEVAIVLLQPFPFRALLPGLSSRCLLGVQGATGAPAPLPGPLLPS